MVGPSIHLEQSVLLDFVNWVSTLFLWMLWCDMENVEAVRSSVLPLELDSRENHTAEDGAGTGERRGAGRWRRFCGSPVLSLVLLMLSHLMSLGPMQGSSIVTTYCFL